MDWLLYIMVYKYSLSLFVWWINSVLLTASRWGHKDIVEILSSKVAYVDVTNNDGKTPLHYGEKILNIINIRWIIFWFAATENGRLDILEYLLSKGADINFRANNGMTALHDG